jgi:hypothetical protein
MIDKKKFNELLLEEESFKKFEMIMHLRFELDKIRPNEEEVKLKIKELFDELNECHDGFSTGDSIRNAFELCGLMLGFHVKNFS